MNGRWGPKTRRDAIAAVDRKITAFHSLVIAATRHWRTSPDERTTLRQLSGARPVGPLPLLSDLRARRKSSYILIKRLERHWRINRRRPAQTYFFLTFIDDMGNTSDRHPEVNLRALRAKVDRAMRQMGLSGIVVIEVQPLMNYPRKGRGRTLMFHAHAVAWTTNPGSALAAANTINKSRSWNNAFGAQPLKIVPTTTRKGQIGYLAHYISKLPHDAKNWVPDKKRRGRYILMQTTAGYRPELALRIFEGLSQIGLPEVVFGVGEGAPLRQAWRRDLMAWHRERLAGLDAQPSSIDVAAFWRELRTRHGSKLFEPYRWLTGRERPKSVH